MKSRLFQLLICLIFFCLLYSCREPDKIGPNNPPVANEGPDKIELLNEKVSLDGSGSYDKDGDLLSFHWDILARPRGSYVLLSFPDSIKSAIIPDMEGTYVIKLTVTDQIEVSDDTISITAKAEIIPPKWPVTTFTPLDQAVKIAISDKGNIYVSDYAHHVIKKITPDGITSTYAGTGQAGYVDGVALRAQFNQPMGIAVDAQENVYVADYQNHSIRKISSSGEVTTIAGFPQAGYLDGIISRAQFNSPTGVAIDANGVLYVADMRNHRIRKITTLEVSTLAGNANPGFANGVGESAKFNLPIDLTLDPNGTLYVADMTNHQIRKITSSGAVTSVAGITSAGFKDGTGIEAQFNNPYGIVSDQQGNVYVADFSNNAIRKVTPTGEVTTIAGNGKTGSVNGVGIDASFNFPSGVAVNPDNKVYVADFGNKLIRLITLE